MIKLEVYAGDEIGRAIDRAIHHARGFHDQVGFDFNGVDVVVDSLSDPKLIYREWMRGLNGYLGKNPTVGPHPKQELSAEEIASDAAIESEHEKRRAEQQASKSSGCSDSEQVTAQRFHRRSPSKPYPYETQLVKAECGCLVAQTKDKLGWWPPVKCQGKCGLFRVGIGC